MKTSRLTQAAKKKARRCHPESPLGVRDLHLAVVGAGVYDRPAVALGFRR